ncbi:MAG: MarR family winged helix-turn-helix transcriptional regulator [Myxococcota bacterium]
MHDQFSPEGIVLENALAFWVHRVYQATQNASYAAFREAKVELTPEQWVVLVALWRTDGLSQNALCELTYRDKPTMSRMIAGLEERGLVVRRESPSDARSRLVYLTRAGKALEAKLVPIAQQLVTRMTSGVPERDLATTRRTLQRLFENLQSP